MGADLYITALNEKQRQQWEKRFERAARQRDRLPDGTPEHAQAQKRVELCYDKMRARGYFRDSYNDSDLLWKFGLSWWRDIIPLLEDDRYLSVGKTTKLLAMLKEHEPDFERNVADVPEQSKQYFHRKYEALQNFLGEAIALDLPIECSL
jgi:hypothetical protein